MANLSKLRRDRLIDYIEKLKQEHTDDESIMLFNELQNALTEKRYGLVFEEHSEAVDEMLEENIPVLTADPDRRICTDPALPWNFLIEGDNLQALYLLEKTHKGKVDCIYIDPPYNTGARDWKYNNDYVGRDDDYRHSKWLSMIKSRLSIAKKLLNPNNSCLIVTIDEKEYLHLGCLLEEMFPTARIQMVSSVINRKGVAKNNEFSRCDEFLFFVMLGEAAPALTEDNMLDNETEETKPAAASGTIWLPMRRAGTNSLRRDRPKLFYPIYVEAKSGRILSTGEAMPQGENPDGNFIETNGIVEVWPIKSGGEQGRWQLQGSTVMARVAGGTVRASKKKNGEYIIQYLNEGALKEIEDRTLTVVGKDENGALIVERVATKAVAAKSVWNRVSHDATANGTNLIGKILASNRFSFPKSLYAVRDTIRFFVADKPDAIIIDFFAGSGTTQHAVNLLNAEDGGRRRCIMVTNNEVSVDETKDLTKKGYKPGDEEWDCLGIARYVTWPRTVGSIRGVDVNGVPLKGDYLAKRPDGTTIPMMAGFSCNVKYFKCDWVPRVSEEPLAEMLMTHIKEMIELEHAVEVDGRKIVVVLSEEEADQLEQEWEKLTEITHIYISRNVLLTTKQNELFHTVEIHTIPDYYFDIEMKEVGEAW